MRRYCVILRVAVLIEYQSVTYTQTDRQTHNDGIYHASMASHGKNAPKSTYLNAIL